MATSSKSDSAVGVRIVHSPAEVGPEIEALAQALRSVSPEVSVRQEEPGVYGAWEWLLPAAVMLYIGKGFLDGFLNEIGAGTAKALKTALVNAFRKGKSTGVKWATVEQMEHYVKKVDEAAELGQITNAIDHPGKPRVPLRISVDLPHGVEARFVFPADLNENQVHQALDELKSVLPLAFARDQRRAELLTIQLTDADQAMRLALFDSLGSALMYREATYVYDPNKSNWIDADEAHLKEVRRQLEAKAQQNLLQVNSPSKARGQKRKRKKQR